MPDCILAIDAGTTGVTALLVGHDGIVQARGYHEFPQHFPQPGWVEHDAEQIWQAVLVAMSDALTQTPNHRPIAIGIANQRETCLFWDRKTGEPLRPLALQTGLLTERVPHVVRLSASSERTPDAARSRGLTYAGDG